jgi:hypothetical protein
MLQEMLNQVKEVYSNLEGVQAAVFSFWMICVAFFYGGIIYLISIGIKSLFQRFVKPQGLNPKNRF